MAYGVKFLGAKKGVVGKLVFTSHFVLGLHENLMIGLLDVSGLTRNSPFWPPILEMDYLMFSSLSGRCLGAKTSCE